MKWIYHRVPRGLGHTPRWWMEDEAGGGRPLSIIRRRGGFIIVEDPTGDNPQPSDEWHLGPFPTLAAAKVAYLIKEHTDAAR